MHIDIGGIYVGGLWDNGIKSDFPNLFKDNSQPQTQPRFSLTQYDGINDGIKTEAEKAPSIY